MSIKHKYCGKCRVFKPRSEFNKRKASADGLAFNCRTCTKNYAAWYRNKYPKTPEMLAKQREYNRVYRKTNRQELNERKKKSRAEKRRIEAIRARFA